MTTFEEKIFKLSGTRKLNEFLMDNVRLDLSKHLPIAICDITTGCNLNCTMCSMGARVHRTLADFSLAEAMRGNLMPHVARLSIGCRHEPLLHPELDSFVSAVAGIANSAESPVSVSLLTSGTLMTGELAARLSRAGLSGTQFSVDSSNPLIYEKIRAPAKWTNLKARLETYMDSSGNLAEKSGILMIAMNSTLPYISQTIQDLSLLGFKKFTMSQIIASKEKDPETFRPTSMEVKELDDLLAAYRCSHGAGEISLPTQPPDLEFGAMMPLFTTGKFWNEDLLGRRTRTVCVSPWYKVRVDQCGFVFPCQNITDQQESWGNIHENPLDEILNNPRATAFREGHLLGMSPCRTCTNCPFGPTFHTKNLCNTI